MSEQIPDTAVVPVAEKPPEPNKIMQAKTDAVAALTTAAYAKASELKLTKEESAALLADFPDEAFRTGAAGKENLIYIEHANLRDRLNEVFGLGQWALIPVRHWEDPFRYESIDRNGHTKITEGAKVYCESIMVVRGCFVGAAIGDMDYHFNNNATNYGDAFEGAKTAAFRRCAKEFGVGLQAWRKAWTEGWFQRRNGGATPKPQQQQSQPQQQQQQQQQRTPDPVNNFADFETFLRANRRNLQSGIEWMNREHGLNYPTNTRAADLKAEHRKIIVDAVHEAIKADARKAA